VADFLKALPGVLRHEGVQFDAAGQPIPGKTGWVNDLRDPGGETAWGITLAVARLAEYTGPMKDLPYEKACDIYRARYWDAMKGDAQPDQEIAAKMFDAGVNIGMGRAIEHLQDVLNVLNDGQKRWPDVKVDGGMGPATLEALGMALLLGPRYHAAILAGLRALQIARYIEISNRNPKLEAFTLGWLLRGDQV